MNTTKQRTPKREQPVGQTWIIEGAHNGRLVYPKEAILAEFTDDVTETFVYDASDNRDIKLRFWKAMARRKGVNPELLCVVEL